MSLFWQDADGSAPAEQLTVAESATHTPWSWSPDGEVLAFTTNQDVWILHRSESKLEPLVQGPFNEDRPAFSPDGRWLAYDSDESGRPEVYVRPFPEPGGRYLISTGGGSHPRWARESGELFYREGGKMMAVAVRTSPAFSTSTPTPLFDKPATDARFDVTADGQRFVMVDTSEEPQPTQINVVLNWHQELLERVPVP